MSLLPKKNLPQWLPQVNAQVWILALGRLLSQTGTGFTLFYTPIFFVNQVGLSATAVGVALGSAQISGIVGRFLGGSFSDSQFWGRRGTLLLSAVVEAIASFMIAAANNFPSLILGNLVMGLGIGLYWPATEAVVADLTQGGDRSEAYGLTRLADNVGLQLGIIFGGIVISTTGAYRSLFIIDGISFLVFFVVVYLAISETYKAPEAKKVADTKEVKNGWLVAFRDGYFLIFITVNILFTFYISQIHTTLPLYLKNFVPGNFSAANISLLFTIHTALSVILQLPIARFLSRFTRPKALTVSAFFWAVGFVLIDITGTVKNGNFFLAILALSFFAIGIVSYTPFAAAFVADIAPENLRGIYLSINSQCWAIGYLIGPPLGGWVLDNSATVINNFWLAITLTVGVAMIILGYLDKIMQRNT